MGIEKSLNDINECMNVLYKRDLLSLAIDAGSDLVGVGVTSFVKNYFRRSNGGDTNGLVDVMSGMISQTSRKIFNGENIQDRVRAIRSVSESADNHDREVRELSRVLLKMLFAASYAQEEIIAGLANLKTLAIYCKKGQVATKELAELTRLQDLKTVEPWS